jgi:hypothetical protein
MADWLAVVNAVTNYSGWINDREFLEWLKELLAFHEEPCFVEFVLGLCSILISRDYTTFGIASIRSHDFN